MSVIRGVIFDLDGTLINSIECFWLALEQGLRKFGLGPVPVERLVGFLDNGARMDQMFTTLFPGFDAATLAAARLEIRNIYVELERERVRLLPGAHQTLRTLRSRAVKIGIATGRMTPGEAKQKELRKFGLEEFVDAMVTSADGRPKPAPDTVIECVRRLGLAAGDCAFVGDTAADIMAARAAGVVPLGVTTGVSGREALLAARPHAVMDSLLQLLPILDSLAIPPSDAAPS